MKFFGYSQWNTTCSPWSHKTHPIAVSSCCAWTSSYGFSLIQSCTQNRSQQILFCANLLTPNQDQSNWNWHEIVVVGNACKFDVHEIIWLTRLCIVSRAPCQNDISRLYNMLEIYYCGPESSICNVKFLPCRRTNNSRQIGNLILTEQDDYIDPCDTHMDQNIDILDSSSQTRTARLFSQ